MKRALILPALWALLFSYTQTQANVLYVNSANPIPQSPYTSWSMAATNIQDAIGVASSGDTVLVTNGVYAYGGVAMMGTLTNRIAVTNAITVQSVNGPWVTTIEGAGPTNGVSAVRCAWLTNGASLVGFTLARGATQTGGDITNLESGGGIWCASSNALVADCVVVSNTAFSYGCGILRGTVAGSLIVTNWSSSSIGGAVNQAILQNCTIISNWVAGVASPMAMTNCIIYYNQFPNSSIFSSAFSHCCSTTTLSGTGNFTTAPGLFADGVHLTNGSPCIGAGVAPAPGVDIFGMTWSNPPSVGCAEWQSSPLVTKPRVTVTGNPAGFTVGNAIVGGVGPFTYSWLKGGAPLQDNGHFLNTQSSNLVVSGVMLSDADSYQLVVSNSYGMTTSAVASVVIHCVNAAGGNPVTPYTSWDTAATNIQDAISAAATNEIVLVTNGVYGTGGISVDGVITNRVTINKAILVASVNGAGSTIIQGAWNPATTNGLGAIRCAWLTNNAVLSGFTLTGGATQSSGSQSIFGGGIWGSLTTAPVKPGGTAANCIISNNAAASDGGGAFDVNLNHCTITANAAIGAFSGSLYGGGAYGCNLQNCYVTGNSTPGSGGGTYNCNLTNCAVVNNSAYQNGGGADGGALINCTVAGNTSSGYSSGYGAAVYGASLINCIVLGNFLRTTYSSTNYANCTLNHCCTDPLPSGTGNIDVDPQLLPDDIHLAPTSPCIGAGIANAFPGTDIDGQPWNNPPSIGCDEWQPAPVMSSPPIIHLLGATHTLTISAAVGGQPPFLCFWNRNGVPIQDDGHYTNSSTADLAIQPMGIDDAGFYQVVVSNTFGEVTSAVAQVVIHAVSAGGTNPQPPYSTWATAATNIQDALDVASAGDIVLVTNGVYAAGGKVVTGTLTNRVALTIPVTVLSVNGWSATTIEGAWDPVSTNGPGAVRCAYVADGAALVGFILANGATLAAGDVYQGGPLESGGGAWCNSANGLVSNCVLTNNSAVNGGGIANGTLENSLVVNNNAYYGGGAFSATLYNCTVLGNIVSYYPLHGGGTYSGLTVNSIVLGNFGIEPPYGVWFPDDYDNSGGKCRYTYCCTSPFMGNGTATGVGNIFTDAGLLDLYHLSSASPCHGAGSAMYTGGTDLDGQPWNNPPSMGCSEWQPSPLVSQPKLTLTRSPIGFTLGNVTAGGAVPLTYFWLKNGVSVQDNGHFLSTQSSNLVVSGVMLSDADSYQLVVSNSYGMATSAVVQVVIHCVNAAGNNPVAPYASWATAATSIQDAIAASANTDIVLVTNGVYATGGISADGVITNRVTVNKPILVASVNGAGSTYIQGAWDPATTNGLGAIRCAWLTNNAILSGFTLKGGATRTVTSSPNNSMSGGGVEGSSTNAVVCNSIIATNVASYQGGGASSVTLNNCILIGNVAAGSGEAGFGVAGAGAAGGAEGCTLTDCQIMNNTAIQGNGGGTENCQLNNCVLAKNSSYFSGGAYGGWLVNCTVTANTSSGYGVSPAVDEAGLTNCIVLGNTSRTSKTNVDYGSYCTLSYCCADPLSSGTGNIDVDPQLLPDDIHLAPTSPCIGAGTASVVSGTDIDGQPWNNPPAIGCDEWQPAPVIDVPPTFQVAASVHTLTFNIIAAGQTPFSYSWSKDGQPLQDGGHLVNSGTATLTVHPFGLEDGGAYQVVVTNSSGAVTSAVVQVVIHGVSAAGTNPQPPYSTWATAATNIQDAIDVASAGDIVLVTNGIYANGGVAVVANLTNRVALTKPLTVVSVNGWSKTTIQGAPDPISTNGPDAVRCAYVGDGAMLVGFTLANGATLAAGDASQGGPLESGGGVWCNSYLGVVANCVLTNNSAIYGGGVVNGTLQNSLVLNNDATCGGGAFSASLYNCTLSGNATIGYTNHGGGTFNGETVNSIVTGNFGVVPSSGIRVEDDYDAEGLCDYSYSCSPPSLGNALLLGSSNITSNPAFLDRYHISAASPCYGTGSAGYASGTDLDGQPWNNPPSMGCSEVVLTNLGGPLSVSLSADPTNLLVNRYSTLAGSMSGRATYVQWVFGDGFTTTNLGAVCYYKWTNAGVYEVAFTAYNNDHPAGVTTNLLVYVNLPVVPTIGSASMPGGGLQFQFTTESNVNYTVQYATNLAPPIAWQTLTTILYPTGQVVQINDPATNDARYYRLLAQ